MFSNVCRQANKLHFASGAQDDNSANPKDRNDLVKLEAITFDLGGVKEGGSVSVPRDFQTSTIHATFTLVAEKDFAV